MSPQEDKPVHISSRIRTHVLPVRRTPPTCLHAAVRRVSPGEGVCMECGAAVQVPAWLDREVRP